MNQPKRNFGCIVGAAIGTALLIRLAFFLTQMALDGMDANLMRFESEPPEGMDYWHKEELQNAMPGLVTLWSATACIAAFVLWLGFKRRS
jgi:hypothetical protein